MSYLHFALGKSGSFVSGATTEWMLLIYVLLLLEFGTQIQFGKLNFICDGEGVSKVISVNFNPITR